MRPAIRAVRSVCGFVLFLGLVVSVSRAGDLTFKERVQAEEAFDRVRYAHPIGAAKPFEEAVSRSVLEAKVRTYLRQSVALEEYWKSPVTAEMLERETERMARQTRMPERLRELFAAVAKISWVVGNRVEDADLPLQGDGYWYAVRGENCAGAGTYDSGMPSQVGPRDPGIGASAAACP